MMDRPSIRSLVLATVVAVSIGGATAQNRREPLPAPDFANVRYGPHERNVFDLWQAESEDPAPLVIYYHGGGFRGGDKRSLNRQMLRQLLEKGVSVAAANYRLSDSAPFPAQMQDSARALQHVRHDAAKFHIDPDRICATGGSAGSGISQWLAFHDDLADPDSPDPIGRESTRLTCAVGLAAQASYDPRFIRKLFDTNLDHPALAPFFGLQSPDDVFNPKYVPLFEEASPITHATADDPPLMLLYSQKNTPLEPNSTGQQHIHHPKFGFAMKKKLDELGVECVLKLREDYEGKDFPRASTEDIVQFFVAHLKAH